MALQVSPQCHTHVTQGCTKNAVLVSVKGPFSLLALWVFGQNERDKRSRCCGAKEMEIFPLLQQCKLELQAAQLGQVGSRTTSVPVGWDGLDPVVSAAVLCFQTSFGQLL